MDHRVSHCKLEGVQCEAESQTTTHILITSTHCFIILLCPDLNLVKSSDLVEVVSNLVGFSADALSFLSLTFPILPRFSSPLVLDAGI